MKKELNVLLVCFLHMFKIIAIGYCGLIAIINSVFYVHSKITFILGIYCVFYSFKNLFNIK